MKNKLTLGLWHAKLAFSPFRGYSWVVCAEDKKTMIARVGSEQDARAIAVLPEMLEILRVAKSEARQPLKAAIEGVLRKALGE